jgi:hypothetical protein
VTKSPFLFLALDLPPPPIFQDAVEKNIIPQVSLGQILGKFDGVTTQVRFFGLQWRKHRVDKLLDRKPPVDFDVTN